MSEPSAAVKRLLLLSKAIREKRVQGEMSYEEFINLVKSLEELPPGVRRGQFIFNALCLVRRDLAGRAKESDIDPFYDDKKIAPFMAWLAEEWGN